MHIHVLGICGTFMGGAAVLARQAGHRVTGCDANVYPPMSTQLVEQGIELIEGYEPSQIRLKPDVFVIGNVVSRGNPLMEEILNRGLPYVSGPQWLSEQVLRGKWVQAIAGTHGKTTTTAMLAFILEQAGLNPGFLVGGVAHDFPVSARLANSQFFVIEADEYDTAFFDKRSKFVHYRPRTVVLNNLEFDHGDIFPNLAAIEQQFHHLVRIVPGSGRIVWNARAEALERVLERGCWTPNESFNGPGGWHAGEPSADGAVEIGFRDESFGHLRWSLAGEHNVQNALAAIAAARHAGISPGISLSALAKFRGVKRRLETRGTVGGITVYDDFAHHPTAIEATLMALRARIGDGGGRLLAVLEPRSNTMRMGMLKDALPASLAGADRVFCYAANLGWDADGALASLGPKLATHDHLPSLIEAIVAEARTGDHVLVMSNGGFGGIHEKLLGRLEDVAGAGS
ncbi:MAG: UDP-N-acetylmuramate:L-alanyl-gamma-D-glutamyl-meso-diaminopimelate ligase [bacterium]|nr:UDP-N-acetylmuramate:L-alanyl-gamma-D-glutamyl-meso-diaminopimelate ligase [Betaproteobacteria bacterium]